MAVHPRRRAGARPFPRRRDRARVRRRRPRRGRARGVPGQPWVPRGRRVVPGLARAATSVSDADVLPVARDQAGQLAALLDRVRAFPGADAKRAAVVGYSFGARAGLLLAAQRREVRALVSLAGGIGSSEGKGWLPAQALDRAKFTTPILHACTTTPTRPSRPTSRSSTRWSSRGASGPRGRPGPLRPHHARARPRPSARARRGRPGPGRANRARARDHARLPEADARVGAPAPRL